MIVGKHHEEVEDKGSWTDKEVNQIIKNNNRNFVKDVLELLTCEEDVLLTNGLDISVVKSIRERVLGHFKYKELKVCKNGE